MTCAYAVRVALKKFAGVDNVDVSLNKGSASVKLKPGNSIRPSAFWDAVRKNGFTPKVTRVVVRGQVTGNRLEVGGTGELFDIKAGEPLSGQLKNSAGKPVILEGTLTPGKDVKAAVPLEVQTIRP